MSRGQHCIFNGRISQSRLLALYGRMSSYLIRPVVVRSLPAGQV